MNNMLRKELVHELKDNGFPYKHSKQQGYSICGHCNSGVSEDISPTLEELIMACGGRFSNLNCIFNDFNYEWTATYDLIGIEKEGYGFSPEEAVARLWLELKKE